MRTYKMISRSTTTPSSVNPLTKKESVSEENLSQKWKHFIVSQRTK